MWNSIYFQRIQPFCLGALSIHVHGHGISEGSRPVFQKFLQVFRRFAIHHVYPDDLQVWIFLEYLVQMFHMRHGSKTGTAPGCPEFKNIH
ncbi:MAG: hypothetical protein U0O39_09190, partial [Akkermansia sp.]